MADTATALTVCKIGGCSMEYGPGIERAIHLRKFHFDTFRSELGQLRSRRNTKRGWSETLVADGGPALSQEDEDDDEILLDPAFHSVGAAASRVDLRNMQQYKNEDGKFQCPIPSCCKVYKGEQGLVYHVTKSLCEPDADTQERLEKRIAAQQQELLELNEVDVGSSDTPIIVRDTPFFASYRWPQTDTGVWTIAQSMVRRFVDDKRIDRLHPGAELDRRYATDEERVFLRRHNLVSRDAHVHGIIVLKADEVLRILQEFYTDKWLLYLRLRAPMAVEMAEDETVKSARIASLVEDAAVQASLFNRALLDDRKRARHQFYDIHTQCRTATPTQSVYPVALFPGQYQDGFQRFTKEEAQAYTHPPPPQPVSRLPSAHPVPPPQSQPAAASADKRVDAKTESEKAKSVLHHQVQQRIKERLKGKTNVMPKVPANAICAMCNKSSGKKGVSEEMVYCSTCENTSHPTCLGLARELVPVIKTYEWECMECKTCTICRDPNDEEHLMFCDECDRGYHTYCVQLPSIPKGRWICKSCGQCATCGTTTPGPDGSRWRHEYSKVNENSEKRFLCTLCVSCSNLFRAGNFCPSCLAVYRSNDTDLPMVCCDTCDRWIHSECDNIDSAAYRKLSAAGKKYSCLLCRGEQEERHDVFHRKFREKKAA